MAEPPAAPRMTPMLRQYFQVKREHPGALLFFRMGDFFELFFEDAKVASAVLGIALTSRSKEGDLPMAGVPARAVDGYLRRLIAAGHTVVLCDQVEDPRDAKGIVERAVTRVVTAGTVLEDSLLEGGRHNFLAALCLEQGTEEGGLAWIDVSTGRFEAAQVPRPRLLEELLRLAPAELLLPERFRERLPAELESLAAPGEEGPALTFRPEHEFERALGFARLTRHFGMHDLGAFGIEADEPLVGAAAAALAYVEETQRGQAVHLSRLRRRLESNTMLLDRAARSALELTETSRERRRDGSLLWCIDRTTTAAGARLLRDWVLAPLRVLEEALWRQQAVAELVEDGSRRAQLRDTLRGVFDLERITARLALQRSSPRDLAWLRDSLLLLPRIEAALEGAGAGLLAAARAVLKAPPGLVELLQRALVEAPPLSPREGGIVADGFSPELDALRRLFRDSRGSLAELQERELKRSGIPNLKVGYNAVFGYYLEVTHAWRDRVPSDYVRKQTLKNAERYITPELKEHETRVLRAEEEALDLELRLFEDVRREAAGHRQALQSLAAVLAELDAVASLAEAAAEHGWCRPVLDESRDLVIEEGRHPVLAVTLGRDTFVPNDTRLGDGVPRMALVTGPNMAGKSTWLRQNALVVLLAQVGGFVPARAARIGMVDRIFTRVGASDDLVRGASTFMVEMTETASILHHATVQSLVVLDEVGRGTGTFDGLSLARALAEHLATRTGCRTLFATHYHQLTALATELASVQNLSVAVREWGEEILFLHKIVPGGTDRSYGLHVARLAGIPAEVLVRAREILRELESLDLPLPPATGGPPAARQPELFAPPLEKILRALARLDPDRLTPLEALALLAELKTQAERVRPPATRAAARPRRTPGTERSLFEG